MKRYYDNQWEQMFDRLSEFKQEHGHCMVPKRYPPDTKLGTWIHTQRCQYRKMSYAAKGASEAASLTDSCTEVEDGQRLTDDRRIRLEELGFVWSVREVEKVMEPCRISRNSYDDQWDAMLESLAAYKGKYGHCLVPKRCKEDPKLGTWVDTQRVQYKKMKKKLEGTEAAASNQAVYRFTEERIRRLEDLGFVWSIRDDWQKHYDELKKFKKDHGHCNVPARYSNNRRLGIWVSAQRQQYKILMAGDESTQRSTPLTDKRIDQLNELGFTWAVRARDSLGESWSQRLKELQQYKKQYGDCLVPARYPPNPELGIWIGTQRTQYRLYMKAKEEGKQISNMTLMTEERLQQLNELGFVFNLRGGQDEKKDADTVDARMEEAKTETATNFATISDPATSTVDGNSTSVAPRAEAKAFSTLVCVATGRRNITPAVVSESVIPKGVEFMDSL